MENTENKLTISEKQIRYEENRIWNDVAASMAFAEQYADSLDSEERFKFLLNLAKSVDWIYNEISWLNTESKTQTLDESNRKNQEKSHRES